ncbi:MAG: bifunctional methylenetetrahydrofolate dehydrogenase/methenyltetrahydrofolate cyclohydrolase FolD [Candidatus Moranbacteria bacterium CG_4_8_14_3_um_filter_34_16]|nr:MAG: bifunctional methylenetetrahydrofolate dehydrogenase/methenyltetrahydrofolate cyclohydrolase FolD [Candidatus Moranbacteria bacterium CG_4_8_14_3_um_filter_34_16]PJA89249.1 MAG: bifunctional methylenetetrahydrofolate dehydrogenase/methenyltetrahydrofolate cyclohydrolase FolD [Candidatus Moranbacteria bacterium CG_4_9_14_3_um_filter_33_15]
MPVKIIDGKRIAKKIKAELKNEVLNLKKKGVIPELAVILVGENPSSKIYVKNKEKACQEIGIISKVYTFGKNVVQKDILSLIFRLNRDKKINGILVQLPLPKKFDTKRIINMIDPEKDVDCFHPENVGRLFLGFPRFFPCTPAGIMEILSRNNLKIAGKNMVIVGRSNVVGKPLAVMATNADATVTLAHSKTKKLKEKCLWADILVSATGKIGLIKADMVKQGAIVIDVGINYNKSGKLTGDVDFERVKRKAMAITPVPGGVGPMTIAMLLKNTIKAAKDNI